MDTSELEPKGPTKHARVRLAAPRKQLERTIQKMTKFSETTKLSETAMKPEKFVDLLTTLSALQVKLLDLDKEAKDANNVALTQEIETLKSKLAGRPTDEDITAQLMLAKLEGTDSSRLKELKGEVETLKLQTSALQDENTKLSKTNGTLKSANSELTQQVQSLKEEIAELKYAIQKLKLRTPVELIAEAKAKMNGTSSTS